MELHMHSHHWEHRLPDWPAAAIAGFGAGAILMVLELLWSTLAAGGNPWETSHMVAAIVMGPDVLQSATFSVGVVGVALVVHYVLGMVFGLILGAIIAPFHFDSSIGMLMMVGAVFGLVLYMFDFYGMVHFFSWFAEMRSWATFAAHVIFGMATALIYWKLERTAAG
jgi:ribose/xylose/arabinose/galactoside ABC-type transport system permease subunit